MGDDKHFETVEKIAPIAQLLTELGRADNIEDLDVYSPVVFESMGKELWNIYISLCKLDIEETLKESTEKEGERGMS